MSSKVGFSPDGNTISGKPVTSNTKSKKTSEPLIKPKENSAPEVPTQNKTNEPTEADIKAQKNEAKKNAQNNANVANLKEQAKKLDFLENKNWSNTLDVEYIELNEDEVPL